MFFWCCHIFIHYSKNIWLRKFWSELMPGQHSVLVRCHEECEVYSSFQGSFVTSGNLAQRSSRAETHFVISAGIFSGTVTENSSTAACWLIFPFLFRLDSCFCLASFLFTRLNAVLSLPLIEAFRSDIMDCKNALSISLSIICRTFLGQNSLFFL